MTETRPADERFTTLDTFVRRVHGDQDQLIQTLHVAQDLFGHLSHDVLLHVARTLRLPPSTVLGVATFYHLFRFDPPGDHMCTVCTGTACFVKGADAITEAVSQEFGVPLGDTTADRRFTLGATRCIGSCGLAPVCVVDGEVHAHQTPQSAVATVRAALAVGAEAGRPGTDAGHANANSVNASRSGGEAASSAESFTGQAGTPREAS
jgi:bidirectional [NiFe] hydrogenase diaphorase subunit